MHAVTGWSIAGRRVVVTGASSGLGRATAKRLAELGGRVVLAARTSDDELIESIRSAGGEAEFVPIDLASLKEVERTAQRIAAEGDLSVLVNNAGTAERGITADGIERIFGVNVLGPFHLTNLLIPSLLSSDIRPRIVNVSSNAHRDVTELDMSCLDSATMSFTGMDEYQRSKLAMVAWSARLRELQPEIDVFCVHPGMVATPIWNKIPQPIRWFVKRRMLPVAEGAATQVKCASDPALVGNESLYWAREQPSRPSDLAGDPEIAQAVWDFCTETVNRLSDSA